MPTGRELAAGKRGRCGDGASTGVCGRGVFLGEGVGVCLGMVGVDDLVCPFVVW